MDGNGNENKCIPGDDESDASRGSQDGSDDVFNGDSANESTKPSASASTASLEGDGDDLETFAPHTQNKNGGSLKSATSKSKDGERFRAKTSSIENGSRARYLRNRKLRKEGYEPRQAAAKISKENGDLAKGTSLPNQNENRGVCVPSALSEVA